MTDEQAINRIKDSLFKKKKYKFTFHDKTTGQKKPYYQEIIASSYSEAYDLFYDNKDSRAAVLKCEIIEYIE